MYFTITTFSTNTDNYNKCEMLLDTFLDKYKLKNIKPLPNYCIINSNIEKHRQELYLKIKKLSNKLKLNNEQLYFLVSPMNTKDGFGGVIPNNKQWNLIDKITYSKEDITNIDYFVPDDYKYKNQ